MKSLNKNTITNSGVPKIILYNRKNNLIFKLLKIFLDCAMSNLKYFNLITVITLRYICFSLQCICFFNKKIVEKVAKQTLDLVNIKQNYTFTAFSY